MIKTLLLVLLMTPVAAETIITKSHCDEMFEIIKEYDSIKEQEAQEFYERCLASL